MVDILHRVGVEAATPAAVYDALTTVEGLAGWWTDDTTGSPHVGGVLRFRFPVGGFDMEVVALEPSERRQDVHAAARACAWTKPCLVTATRLRQAGAWARLVAPE